MIHRSMYILILFLGATTNCWANPLEKYEAVEAQQIIENPELYNGKRVEVSGRLINQFEHSALYGLNFDGMGALWVSYDTEVSLDPPPKEGTSLAKSLMQFDDQNVVIDGIVNSKTKGHLGKYVASIERVRRVKKLP